MFMNLHHSFTQCTCHTPCARICVLCCVVVRVCAARSIDVRKCAICSYTPPNDTNQCWHMYKALVCSCIDYQSASEIVRHHLGAMARYGAVIYIENALK